MAPYRSQGIVLQPRDPLVSCQEVNHCRAGGDLRRPSAHRSVVVERFRRPRRPRDGLDGRYVAPGGGAATSAASPSAITPDWNGLLRSPCAISGARQVYVTHGNSDGLGPLLRETGRDRCGTPAGA